MANFQADIARRHARDNRIQSVLIIAGMGLLLGLCGYALGGLFGLIIAAGVAVGVIALSGRASPALILKMYKASPLDPRQMPELAQAFAELCRRAELSETPQLYYVPSRMMNAFAVGRGERAAVALTHGLLSRMNLREVVGVLAHEISHIRNRDLWVMGLADSFTRVTTAMGQVGQLMVLFGIPAVLMGATFPWLGAIALFTAPTASALLQFALARTREYDADRGAVSLTGDPMGLASALHGIESAHAGWIQRMLFPGRKVPEASLLRTHPPTAERIARLQAMVEAPQERRLAYRPRDFSVSELGVSVPEMRGPRWHISGLWY